VASQGFVRNKLTVLHGGKRSAGATARTGQAEMPLFDGPLAVAAETLELEVDVHAHVHAADPRLAKIREARMKGYEGDSCGECGNFTLVRNGTCMKCDTCGSTSGCS
jgi:ribonucleoside-diphosphate reductase alpha chain